MYFLLQHINCSVVGLLKKKVAVELEACRISVFLLCTDFCETNEKLAHCPSQNLKYVAISTEVWPCFGRTYGSQNTYSLALEGGGTKTGPRKEETQHISCKDGPPHRHLCTKVRQTEHQMHGSQQRPKSIMWAGSQLNTKCQTHSKKSPK